MPFVAIGAQRSDGVLYVENGFVYRADTIKKGSRYVRCRSESCDARGVIRPNACTIVLSRAHNHEACKEEEESALFRHNIREKAKSLSCVSLRNLYDAESSRLPEGSLLSGFPKDEQVMRRSHNANVPPLPKDLDQLHDIMNFQPLWRDFALACLSPKEFFVETVHVENVTESRVSVMVSPYFSDLLTIQNVEMAMDATFDVRPQKPETEQLLSIHVFETIDSVKYCWPCAYVLMEKKDEASYVAALNSINKAVGGNMHPASLMADFEKAIHNAAKQVFPYIETSGCWFHFCDSVLRQIRELHLADQVLTNDFAEKCVQKCMALPLLPPGEISNGLFLIEEDLASMGLHQSFNKLIKYMKNFWLNDNNVGVETLSVFELDTRTNNAVEQGHYALFNKIRIARSNFWTFYDALRKYDYAQYQDRQRALGQIAVRRNRRKMYVRQDNNIRDMQSQLVGGTLDVSGFLSRACHAVEGLQKRWKKENRKRRRMQDSGSDTDS